MTLTIVDTAGGDQRRDQVGDSLCRPLPDSGAPEHRRHRGDRLDAQRGQGLAQAVRLRPEPDRRSAASASPTRRTRSATRPRSIIADIVARPFIVMRNDHQDALSAGLAVSEYAPAASPPRKSAASGSGSRRGWAMRRQPATNRSSSELRGNTRNYSGDGRAPLHRSRQRSLPESAAPKLTLRSSQRSDHF